MMHFETPYGSIDFNLCNMAGPWRDCPGVYMFARPFGPVVFVDCCESFQDRLADHPQWAEARSRGATAVYAAPWSDRASRRDLALWLIGRLRPPLNGATSTSM